MYDLIIAGGSLIDGTGSAAVTGDIAIKDGLIAEIGGRITSPAKRRIDADGAIVTPGFIDLHSHYDGQISWDDKIDPSFSNGITTTIAGNCGVGFAPARAEDHDRLISLMEVVEAIPGIVLKEGVPWAWETFPDYMEFLGKRSYGVDVGVLMPHAPLRVYAMGDRAVRHEQATAEDIAKMTGWVCEAMAAGAMGVSAGRIVEHMYGDDRANVPGTFAEEDELLAIARAVGDSGHGIFQMIMRGTVGDSAVEKGLGAEGRLAEHALAERIARASGRPVHYLLQQFDSDPGDWKMMLDATARSNEAGVPVYAHVASRGFGMLSMLDGYHAFMGRPAYLEIAHLSVADRAAAMRDPTRRAAIMAQEDAPMAVVGRDEWGMAKYLTARAAAAYLLDGRVDYEPDPSEQVRHIAEASGRSVLDVVYDHLTADDGGNVVAHMFFNYSNGNLDHTREMLQSPYALASLGDGGAHMRLISDVSMMPFHLTFWARDRKRGPTLPLEKMVAKITGDNARAYAFHDRGTLAVGKRADINVIDYDNMRIGLPEMVHDLPAGGGRLNQVASGFIATLLNGVVTRERDADMGERPGRLIRSRR